MTKSIYEELKEKARTMPMAGIFYAFDNEQFVKGCIECGYLKAGQTIDDFKKSDIKLIGDGLVAMEHEKHLKIGINNMKKLITR